MIDKAKSLESFIELIELINQGAVRELAVEFVRRDGTKYKYPLPEVFNVNKPDLKIIEELEED